MKEALYIWSMIQAYLRTLNAFSWHSNVSYDIIYMEYKMMWYIVPITKAY